MARGWALTSWALVENLFPAALLSYNLLHSCLLTSIPWMHDLHIASLLSLTLHCWRKISTNLLTSIAYWKVTSKVECWIAVERLKSLNSYAVFQLHIILYQLSDRELLLIFLVALSSTLLLLASSTANALRIIHITFSQNQPLWCIFCMSATSEVDIKFDCVLLVKS